MPSEDPRATPPPSPGHHLPDVRPEYLALGFLETGPLHGYDLYRRFQAVLGKVWHVSQSQMYSILKRLEAQAFVTASVEAGDGSPARRVLSTSPLGRKRFAEWLASPSDCSSRSLRLEFIARLFFARQNHPDLLPALVQSQLDSIDHHLANHAALLAALPEAEIYNRLGLEFRIRQLASVKAWIEEGVSPLLLDN